MGAEGNLDKKVGISDTPTKPSVKDGTNLAWVENSLADAGFEPGQVVDTGSSQYLNSKTNAFPGGKPHGPEIRR